MTQEPMKLSVPVELLRIGKLLREQDNRGTDQPIFVVQEKREFASDPDRNDSVLKWFDNRDGEYSEVSELRAKRLTLLSDGFVSVAGYESVYIAHHWVAVTSSFTENGCQSYIDANKHNHRGELRIYAEGSFRNREFQLLRNWLMSLPEPITEANQPGIEQEKQARLGHINTVILAISKCGRRFFWSHKNQTAAEMSIDQSGVVQFKCEHTGRMIPVSNRYGGMNGFSHGGTLKSLVIAFGEYIQAGEKLHINNIGLPRNRPDGGYIWGYSKDEIESVLAEVKHLPMFY